VVAQVLGSCQFEQVGIKSRHVGLNVIEKEGLHQMASMDAERHFFKKLLNGKV